MPLKLARASLVALTVTFAAVSAAQNAAAEDEYARIDTQSMEAAIAGLTSADAGERRKTLAAIRQAPENYPPPVFYTMSGVLFEAGAKDEAAFWFYAAQLRASFDANRCADVYARRAVDVLNYQHGKAINRHAASDIAKLEALIPKVVEWDRRTPHAYDHRWINLHGLNATAAGQRAREAAGNPALSLPRTQWPEIAERTRTEYLAGFRAAIASLKAHPRNRPQARR